MKRKCEGCKALEEGNEGQFKCGLGFKIEQIIVNYAYSVGAKPLEKCPKPRTYSEYLNLK